MTEVISLVGTQFEPFTYTVERGKIKEFVLAIGDDNPLYTSVEEARKQGYRDIPIPLTFPTVIELWGGISFEKLVETLRANPLMILHGDQSYEYLGQVCAGDELTGVATIVNHRSRSSMTIFGIETVYHNREGEKVLIARSTLIERKGE